MPTKRTSSVQNTVVQLQGQTNYEEFKKARTFSIFQAALPHNKQAIRAFM
jgi:hypothetical protein